MGRIYSYYHADTVCTDRDSRNISGTIFVFEVGRFGKDLRNYEDVEVSASANA